MQSSIFTVNLLAKRLCTMCDVRSASLDPALAVNDYYGLSDLARSKTIPPRVHILWSSSTALSYVYGTSSS